jgi:biopolymer transport protein ExbB/TolQ
MIHSLFQLFNWLGSEWVLVLLGILSVLVLAVGAQRALALKKATASSKAFWQNFGDAWVAGSGGPWKSHARDGASLEEAVLLTVDRNAAKPAEDVQRKVAAVVEHRKLAMERNVSLLGTIGANGAFVGLLGTVLGIIRAFDQISAGGAQSGIENISSGIAEALVATAVGIFVAIPAVVLYNYFGRKIGTLCRKALVAGELALSDRS